MNTEANKPTNIAFIDGQNLHLGTTDRIESWAVDYVRFRTYLREKYKVSEANYFMGFSTPKEQDLYNNLERAGFILYFRAHPESLKSDKKGNIDCDIIFNLMKKLVLDEPFGKAYIISGDGDYKKMVDFLIQRNKFGKMLFPNTGHASSLYELLGSEYYDFLDSSDVKAKIAYFRDPKMKKAP